MGSYMTHSLSEDGHTVTLLDNLSTGPRDAKRWGEFVKAYYRIPPRIVLSSTATAFCTAISERIKEDHPKNPIHPYGASKLMAERILADAATAYGLRSVALRCFSAAGALPDHGIDEAHACETHLIPSVLRAALGTGQH